MLTFNLRVLRPNNLVCVDTKSLVDFLEQKVGLVKDEEKWDDYLLEWICYYFPHCGDRIFHTPHDPYLLLVGVFGMNDDNQDDVRKAIVEWIVSENPWLEIDGIDELSGEYNGWGIIDGNYRPEEFILLDDRSVFGTNRSHYELLFSGVHHFHDEE